MSLAIQNQIEILVPLKRSVRLLAASSWYSGIKFSSHMIFSLLKELYVLLNLLQFCLDLSVTEMEEVRASWLDRFVGDSSVQCCWRLISLREGETRNLSIFVSDVPLWWWKVGSGPECSSSWKFEMKLSQALILLGEDLGEQLQSVPITTV